MPTHERLGTNDCENLKDRWEPAIEMDEEPPLAVRNLGPPLQPASQDDQLMSERRILRLKPALRLEWRGDDGQNETEQPDHSASLGDSNTSSTRIRFSVHTGGAARVIRPAASAICPVACSNSLSGTLLLNFLSKAFRIPSSTPSCRFTAAKERIGASPGVESASTPRINSRSAALSGSSSDTPSDAK